MFRTPVPTSKTRSFFAMANVTYHTMVHTMRGGHRNAVVGILMNALRGLTLVVVFFVMFQLIGMRSSPVRGDYLLFIMTGVFMFLTHVMAVSEISGAGNPLSPMMLHPPMNTMVAIIAAALTSLYKQFLTIVIVLTVYHILVNPVYIDQPARAMGMFVLAWATGCAVGLVFLGLKPWFPNMTPILINLYRRANMIASGKMFLANALPASMVALFDWNPLFHIIDQTRGFVFLHYNPFQSSLMYPIYVGIALVMIGLMGEFFTRQHVSLSWTAGR
ncbi:MAG: ABC transporter permease [Yoonia sp.]|uniref:ABC transporter permease n=1 Tax=Yoonia sp. TaxID=2212373 RepID=UPI003EF72560